MQPRKSEDETGTDCRFHTRHVSCGAESEEDSVCPFANSFADFENDAPTAKTGICSVDIK